ncbi:phosphoribosylformylglycinamidine cyclo-ligase [Brevibacillus laterosporus]|uniref:Phosphoribosylformylglycinamidine cyclo-ligase n=1 Tax=Brevibacillus laterosporus TaxID=1465 RepID=A0AAP3DJT1_BRELA|nr:phosphoribosylformylglycinamidine cyclo-ligase [Brevibacillus laterosporus]AYB40059.1 phosphoribosylformylglycinamidine cyclo-ligase [Brevibacillus laterosporus]MBG9800381.1 phosphoribosylaminoimidazole synthetase [Brevibacillus laterosporus]MBM7108467.1 Phosphoribosylformylglycinamidine cyclo-ligase [Brevibacillus laterosporus]MCR8938143.1 phosphoribosylformylglycinamidine cyclo-ligase [Brevibacillus laterosporus]MCR8982253.1 phosphoribosylformylglycinamidine cyclo-ligase [Brevibacillus la
MSQAYKEAGVDIAAGNEAVERMKKHVKRTFRPEVMSGLGGFGALFRLNVAEYKQPVLVSGTDGVGTKLKLAFQMDQHDTIGIDAVAMCVNDVVVQGAEPLYFLDYVACDKVIPTKLESIVKGIADGCEQAGCALIGGETAEMPGMYAGGEYDIAGFTVGVVEESKIIDGSNIQAGDMLIGITSSGVHSNGFSLVRKVLLQDAGFSLHDQIEGFEKSLGEVLLTPTKIYVKPILSLLKQVDVKGMAHITGGGFTENIPRMLPDGLQASITLGSWPVLPIFKLIEKTGNINQQDMFLTFNMGIGMVLAVAQKDAEYVLKMLQEAGEEAYLIGDVQQGDSGVVYVEGEHR